MGTGEVVADHRSLLSLSSHIELTSSHLKMGHIVVQRRYLRSLSFGQIIPMPEHYGFSVEAKTLERSRNRFELVFVRRMRSSPITFLVKD